jgi:hypothetical protein
VSVETSFDEWATALSVLWWWTAFFIIFGCGFLLFDDKRYFWGTVNVVLGVWVGFNLSVPTWEITSSSLVTYNSSIVVTNILTTSICLASLSGVVAHKFRGRIIGKTAKSVVIFFLALVLVVQLLTGVIRSWL